MHSKIGFVLVGIGFFACNIITKLIVCTLTKKTFEIVQVEIMLSALFPLISIYTPSSPIKNGLLLGFFVGGAAYVGLFSYKIVIRIAEYLKIRILTVA